MPRKPKAANGSTLGIRIGRNIKIARLALGLTQAQVAESLDLENVTLSRLETGAQLPSIERLDEVARVLKVSLTALLADTDKDSAMADMLVEVIKDLPAREKKFVYEFAASYAAHWKAGKRK